MATPLSGLTWGSNTVTWAFASAGSSGMGNVTDAIADSTPQAAVVAGIQQWAKVSGLNLVQVADPSQADVQIGYGSLSGLLGESMWSYNPADSQYSNALVLLQDPAVTPLIVGSDGSLTYSGSASTLQQLATHEFGAALGLAESSDPNSVMNHMQQLYNQTPDAADVAAIDSLYGAPAGSASGSAGASSSDSPAAVSPDQLTLQLSEDAWQGDAQFIVKVNGQQMGGPTSVTALNSDGASETFNYTGTWGAKVPSVEIDFINDAYGGSASQDRNLYIDQVSYDGAPQLSGQQALFSDGAFALPAA